MVTEIKDHAKNFSNAPHTCSKEQIMRKELSLDFTVLKSYINPFENSMKQDIFSIESSVDLDQLPFSDAMLNNISDIIVFLYLVFNYLVICHPICSKLT